MTILAVDPSSRSCGLALVSDDGRVLACGVIRATRIGLMARHIWEFIDARFGLLHSTRLVIERATPQTRKGIYTDNYPVGVAAGMWIMAMGSFDAYQLMLIKPQEWRKGMLQRGIKGRDAYKAAAIVRANQELLASGLPQLGPEVKGLDDLADAVCIGVYAAAKGA